MTPHRLTFNGFACVTIGENPQFNLDWESVRPTKEEVLLYADEWHDMRDVLIVEVSAVCTEIGRHPREFLIRGEAEAPLQPQLFERE